MSSAGAPGRASYRGRRASALPKQQTPLFACVCALAKRVSQQFCSMLPLVLDDAALRLLSRSSQPTASSLGAMGPHSRRAIALSDWLSHSSLPWTHVLHRPTRKICDPACLVLPKGSPAGVLHASHHAPPLFSGLLGFLQLVPTATFELAVGPNWQPDSSGGQRTPHFPFHRVHKLVGLSRRLRRRLAGAHLTGAPHPGG
jgi:hypothetical protein